MKKVQELRTISTLSEENRRLWKEMMATVAEAVAMTSHLEKALDQFSSKTAAATKDWLAFWGIYAEAGGILGLESLQ
jgi:uncharacterized protein (DUF2252 family)